MKWKRAENSWLEMETMRIDQTRNGNEKIKVEMETIGIDLMWVDQKWTRLDDRKGLEMETIRLK